jgi:hypothetical protein
MLTHILLLLSSLLPGVVSAAAAVASGKKLHLLHMLLFQPACQACL